MSDPTSQSAGPAYRFSVLLGLLVLLLISAPITPFLLGRFSRQSEHLVSAIVVTGLFCAVVAAATVAVRPTRRMRRILSLIVTPSTPYHAPLTARTDAPDARKPTPPPPDPQKATQRYLESVNGMIDDLQRANRRAKDYERTAAWHDNFARKIMDLPAVGVDPAAVAFGDSIASRFRALGASLRGQGVNVNAQQRTLTYDIDYDPGWAGVSVWGGVGYREPSYNVSSNLKEVREQQAAAVSAGADEREQIWQLIEDERAEMTRKFP